MTPAMMQRAKLMGDIWLPQTNVSPSLRAVGDLSQIINAPNHFTPIIRAGLDTPPVVEVYFPYHKIIEAEPIAILVGKKVNVRTVVKAVKAHVFVRGRCIANTSDYAYVELDANVVADMKKCDVRVAIPHTLNADEISAFDVTARKGREEHKASWSLSKVMLEQGDLTLISLSSELKTQGLSLPGHHPFTKKGVLLVQRMSVVVPNDRDPTRREEAVAEVTRNPIIRRPSHALRFYPDEKPAVAA